MNFVDACNEVISTVKRPDKAAEVRREVNAAISFYVLDNRFPRDFVEQTIDLDVAQYTQSFPLGEMTRFREFKYLKRGGTTKFLSLASMEEMQKGCTGDKYYIAGSSVNLSLAKAAATLDVGFYAYPPILVGTQTFWMLDMAPFMIIDRACGAVFRSIGDERSFQAHAVSARDAYLAFRKDQLSSQ